MFSIRQFSYVFLQRIYCSSSNRYQSSTTNHPVNSSSSNDKKNSSTNSTVWATSDTNGLVKQLSARIKSGGPITVAEFMRESLLNPKYGYYTRHEVFGKKGDFITAPEISQMFGELLAVWVMYEHSANGNNPMQLVELGPGRGTLMNDIIRVLKKRNYSDKNTFIALYEASPLMRRRQAETLFGRSFDPFITHDYRIPNSNYSLVWIDDLKQLKSYNTYFIANELFDAYPIHKFQKTAQGWKEVMIDWNPITKQLQYVLSPRQTTMSQLYQNFLSNIEERQHVEISPQRSVMMQNICKHVKTHGGSALIGDYGHWGEKEDTFRGFRKHEVVDALSDPGNIDITADVDFEELALSGTQISNVQFYGPISQRNFLYNLGIDIRATTLARDKTPEEQKEILSAVEKLVSPNHMGERFIYLCVQNENNKKTPAGFSSPY
ncbi:unnamed protein product [Rotaria sordida]|uniref:Protein arginine methyltransferase NDUFAF7 n=1 Tax=Rotaria sordida TaxID=392033 RepID=A0A813SS87_9BILA|nr:unnamed protein product [Rotaria sordida]CAF0804677.1 unnamed protein product [Rotaria sordida]